jgi:hypothetical protein
MSNFLLQDVRRQFFIKSQMSYGSDGGLFFHSNLYTVKKSVPFFNLTLDILLNLQEKFYQCINFGAW